MKDLYRKLEIEPDAHPEEVSAALERNPDMGELDSVLLNDEKRSEYDEAYRALKAIGVLRQNLGLDTTDTWFVEKYPDFCPRLVRKKLSAATHKPESAISAAETPCDTKPRQKPSHKRRPKRSNTPVLVAIILVAVAVIALAVIYL